jgi:hypothetical protein
MLLEQACERIVANQALNGELPVEKAAIAQLRVVRMMKLAFIISGLLLILVAYKVPAPPQRSANHVFDLVIFIVALTSIAVGFLAPRFFKRVRQSQSQPGSAAINQWMSANVFSLACFDVCMLIGLVLHLVSARVQFNEIAFAAGMISLLIWKPQPPPTSDMAKDTAVKAPPIGDQPVNGVHMYRVSAPNKAVFGVLSIAMFCFLLFGHFHQIRLGLNTATALKRDLIIPFPLFVLTLFMAIRSFQMRVTITNSQVEIINAFRTYTIPFAEISGFRIASRGRSKGIYLCRRGKSRVFVNESMYRLDDFYWRWRASIYDRDKADRLKRKADGKERLMDSLFDDKPQQHPAIGGPDALA